MTDEEIREKAVRATKNFISELEASDFCLYAGRHSVKELRKFAPDIAHDIYLEFSGEAWIEDNRDYFVSELGDF